MLNSLGVYACVSVESSTAILFGSGRCTWCRQGRGQSVHEILQGNQEKGIQYLARDENRPKGGKIT